MSCVLISIEACLRIIRLDQLSIMMQRCDDQAGLPVPKHRPNDLQPKSMGQAGNFRSVWAFWSEMSELEIAPAAILWLHCGHLTAG